MFLPKESGLNDDLNGVERPVSFDLNGVKHEVVHSLAKWKRWYLDVLEAEIGQGIVADMRAIRADEEVSAIHSYLVDQWDWEKVIDKKDRSIETLITHGNKVFDALQITEKFVCLKLRLESSLPAELTVIYTEDLYQQYPDFTPKQREHEAAKEFGAILLIGIGGKLSNGEVHDYRAPDYDDWSTKDEFGRPGMNADIIVWDKKRSMSLEISSMGVRVDEKALTAQLKERGVEERVDLPFHKALIEGNLPYTIGGGIGQSRVLMLVTGEDNISAVQSSYE